jgi:hypothetical protein
MTARTRLLANEAYDSGYVNNDKNYTWQREMEHKYKGKPRTPGRVLPEDTFTKSSSEIANILKSHSEDYAQAMAKLNSYINRQGRNLQGADRKRLYDAKDSLKQAYGEMNKTESSTENPFFNIPSVHNLDDKILRTGIDEDPDSQTSQSTQPVTDMALNAATRLLGSIYNTVQDPSPSDTHTSNVTAEKWSQKVTDSDDKSAVPEGTFTKSAEDIAKTLKRVSKDHGQASERLNFYKNRGGENVDKSKLDKAGEVLKRLYGDKD